MSDILLHDVPDDLRRKLEERARAHRRTLADEAERLLESALAEAESSKAEPRQRLGALLAGLFPVKYRGDDFVSLRDPTERPPPFVE